VQGRSENAQYSHSTLTDKTPIAEQLLAEYRLWGAAAVLSFVVFLLSICLFYHAELGGIVPLFGILLTGFLWIGATSLSRHSLIRLKQYMGIKVGVVEFISSQMVMVFFPFYYFRLKKEVGEFTERDKADAERTV